MHIDGSRNRDDIASWSLGPTAESKWEVVIIGRASQRGGCSPSDAEEVFECPVWLSDEAKEGDICWSSSSRVAEEGAQTWRFAVQ